MGHDVALGAGVLRDPTGRLDQRATDDGHAGRLVAGQAEVAQGGGSVHQGGAAAGDDALLDGRAGRRDGVLEAVLLLLELDLGGRAHAQHRDAARELGQTLLELLAVPVGVARLDLVADLADAVLDVGLRAGTVDDGRVVLGDGDATGGAQHVQLGVVQAQADLFGDDLATGEDGDVLEHGLATLAETGRLDRGDVERAAHLVQHQGAQGVALDVLGDDQQRLLGLDDLLQERQQLVEVADLALADEDEGVLQHRLLAVPVRDEVGGDVALVELQTLGEVELQPERRGLLDGDDTVLADLVERLGDQVADLGVLGRVGRHVGDVGALLDRNGALEQGLRHLLGGGVDALLQGHRGGAGGHAAQALADQRLGQHGGGGGSVARGVVGLGGDLLDQLGAQVLVGLVQLDLTGDGHTVVRDGGGTELLVDDDVAAARTERHLHGVGETVHAPLEGATGVVLELQDLRHLWCFLLPL